MADSLLNTQSKILIISVVLLLSACGGTNKKEYPELELVDPSIRIATQWVTELGALSEQQIQQLPSVVFENSIYVANSDGNIGNNYGGWKSPLDFST